MNGRMNQEQGRGDCLARSVNSRALTRTESEREFLPIFWPLPELLPNVLASFSEPQGFLLSRSMTVLVTIVSTSSTSRKALYRP
jgi:hypothetical protein